MGIVFNVQKFCLHDGDGIRTCVFLKGCPLRCIWCHNPESQSSVPQMMFFKDQCVNCGKCTAVCPNHQESCDLCGKCVLYCPIDARKVCGKKFTADQVFAEIIKDRSYYEASGGGVTFSGGECMLQVEFLLEILKKCKEAGIHTAVDTAGYVSFENFEKILPYTDLFLYDVKLFDNQKHMQYVGVSNELIFKNLKRLFDANANIWIRIPVIAGINDSEQDMKKLRMFLDDLGKPDKMELLPYHSMGEHKYLALGKAVQRFKAPDPETMEKLRRVIE